MNVNELLRAARARIAKAEHWTQGDFAKTAHGNAIGPTEGPAVCWCAAGALEAEYAMAGPGSDKLFYDAAEALEAEMDDHIYSFNDTRSHADVLAAFDRAIEATKEAA